MKSDVYRFFLVSGMLFFNGTVLSQDWISLNDDTCDNHPVSLDIIEDNDSAYRVHVKINGFYDTGVVNDYGTFHYLSLGNVGRLWDVGMPSLPIISQFIAIPSGATMSVSLENEIWTDKKIGTIYPAQGLLNEENKVKGFHWDKEAYRHSFIPPTIHLSEENSWHGIRNVAVNICPFMYYPKVDSLCVLKEFVLRVDFHNMDNHSNSRKIPQEKMDGFAMFDNHVFIDVSSSEDRHNLIRTENYDYLIVVGNNAILNSNKMKEFRRWKGMMGYKTKVVSFSNIGTTTSALKEYIADEYLNGVKYVLLVGDETSIPLPNIRSFYYANKSIDSDYWYGCIHGDSDWMAQVVIGRFSTNSLAEFSYMVDKTIRYESCAPLSNDFLLVAHKLSPNDIIGYQACCETIKNQSFNEPVSFVTAYGASTSLGGDDATNSDVISAINQGIPLVNYRGFGYASHWGGINGGDPNYGWNTSDELFCSSQSSNMDSTSCAVFFCVSANTGNITQTDNMLEKFTRARYGAAAFLGSTTQGYPNSNHLFNQYLFNELLDVGIYTLGDINLWANISNVTYLPDYYTNYFKDNAFSYIIGGDPTLEIWTAVPQFFGNVDLIDNNGYVTINTQINSTYNVSVVTEDGDLLNTISVNGNTCTFTKPEGNFFVTINKHNYLPHIIYYNVDADAIQNTEFNYDAYYNNTPLAIGYGVTPDVEDGDVIVKSGHKLIIKNGSGGVTLDYGFECEKGAVLEIK